jgi:hypothetical protein
MPREEAAHCPKCGYPSVTAEGKTYRGIYKPGQDCPHCHHKEARTLSDVEYQMTQDILVSCAQVIRSLPLSDFLLMIERAEAEGPIIDPTLFRKAMFNLSAVKKMAEGALAFQGSLPKVCPQCKQKPLAYEGAKYCGSACSVKAEAGEAPAESP